MVTRLNYTDLSIIILDLPTPQVRAKSPPMCIFSCVNVCFYAGLPRPLVAYIQCECVFPCWTPTELVYPRVNVCFHAGLPQSLSVIRLYEKIGFELVGLFKCLQG